MTDWKKKLKTFFGVQTPTYIPKEIPKQLPKRPPPKPETPKEPPKQSFNKPEIPKPPSPKPLIEKEYRKKFLTTFEKLTYRHRAWDVWRDFIIMAACAISSSVDKANFDKREERYLQIIKKYNDQEQVIFPELLAYLVLALDKNPEQDFLGSIYMELNLGDGKKGQFFTPYDICKMMAQITMTNVTKQVEKDGYISIGDTCCGAGATLIAGIHEARRQLEKNNLNFQNHVMVVGQDIDEIVGLMCYIQISFLGVAGYVKISNTITDPIAAGDTVENYWFTPMYFSNVWHMRRIFHNIDELTKGE